MPELLLFVPACFALNLAFGPNNLMALSNGAQRGIVFAFVAGLGRLLVFVPMIAASALGLGLLLSTSALIFSIVKFVGAAYLIWLGWKTLRSAATMSAGLSENKDISVWAAFKNESLVACSNPKAILIFAAFFPQFVITSAYTESYVMLGAIFLGLEAVALTTYAAIGSFAARAAKAKLHWFQGVSGLGMMLFGGLLLFARRPT